LGDFDFLFPALVRDFLVVDMIVRDYHCHGRMP
jgi:hypothetical protein